jgi:hypothetical protein
MGPRTSTRRSYPPLRSDMFRLVSMQHGETALQGGGRLKTRAIPQMQMSNAVDWKSMILPIDGTSLLSELSKIYMSKRSRAQF